MAYGCHFPSDMALEGKGGRNAYNIEVQKTNAEEMLLNLVRLRYYDSPFFLQVSSVTSQFTFKNTASASINIPGFNQTNPMILGGETQWQNQPTIQYSPLEGQEFANQLMQPIDLSTLQQVIFSGWDVDRVFQLTVQNLQDYHNISKEGIGSSGDISKYEDFYKISYLMRRLQLQGLLQVGYSEDLKNHIKMQSFQIAFPKNNVNSEEIAKFLRQENPVNGKYVISLIQGFDSKGNIGILTRSLLSCMYFLSHCVDVPKKDIKSKKAVEYSKEFLKNEDIKGIYRDLMNICSSPIKPKDAYVSIKYRDSWFYIQDCDLQSKRTFMLLLELYNLQAQERKASGPVLTLPIGVS